MSWQALDGGSIALTCAYAVSKQGAAKLLAFAAQHSIAAPWELLYHAAVTDAVTVHTSATRMYKPVLEPNEWNSAPAFDCVYYINLEHRTDRLTQVRAKLDKVGWSGIATRVPAVYTPDDGAAGCGQSHVLALQAFLASGHATALILEDNVEWTEDPRRAVAAFLRTQPMWDLVMLASNTITEAYSSPLATRIISAATTAAYGITRRFAHAYAIDMSWKELQPAHSWFCLRPKVARQRRSYSDIKKCTVDYGLSKIKYGCMQPALAQAQCQPLRTKKLIREMVKYHLGCGRNYMEGWVNVDISPNVRADVHDDVTVLSKLPDGSASMVYASHVLEHTGRRTWADVLKVWAAKLQPGGVLRVAVPDFAAAVRWYTTTGDIEAVTGLVCGGQRNAQDYHYIILDHTRLAAGLEAAGLTAVRTWDWRCTEHAQYDDYSQAYLPHMAKDTGALVSLNLEATKPFATPQSFTM